MQTSADKLLINRIKQCGELEKRLGVAEYFISSLVNITDDNYIVAENVLVEIENTAREYFAKYKSTEKISDD